MKKYIEKNEDVFFIQIGANDGRYDPDNDFFDPLNPIINKYKINGIIIEPQKRVFDELEKTYYNYNNLILENIAIDKKTIEKDLYKISFSSA